ncbi:MAG: MIP/aquaporin family protein, partial [Brevefilum sp.]
MRKNIIIKEIIGEVVGTFILILLGVGVNAHVSIGPRLSATAYNWVAIALGWGLGYGIAIYIVDGVSSAHLNPAVTLALAVKGEFPWKKVIPYFIAQILGAFLGAMGV